RQTPASGVAPPRTAAARAVVTPPVIDGRLTDPAWREATPVTGFVQRELHEGALVTERTEVRILTDAQAVYVGAWLYDSDPTGIVPGEKVRDGDISKSDYFGILLDTYHDRQNGFVFTTTPAGIEYDAPVVNERERGGSRLPGQTPALSGSLEGVQGPSRRVWTATPYALTGMERNYTIDAEARSRGELGGEVKYGVTPSLTLDLTYNTDFAQVEVDEQRTNLTRFPLFFPEKR